MELSNENEFNQYNEYTEKLKNLDGGINTLLDEFKRLYIVSKMNPTNEEYSQQFQNIVNNLESVLSQLFTISNSAQVNIDNINKKLLELNDLIKQERQTNNDLKKKLGMIENDGNASTEMINDYTDIYNMNYLRNWSLLLSSIFCIITIGVIYKKPGV
jgi:DNA-binding ferritin-like protein